VILGLGSGELLRVATETYSAKDKPYVTADPSFAIGERWADLLAFPVKRIPLDAAYRLDLDAMLDATSGAGLLYVCNPNNPTATIHSGSDLRSFIASVLERSPTTRILVDEAYCDYVVDDSYESMLDLVSDHPQVIIARTFSKAYGMAGLRIGYAAAHSETITQMSRQRGMDMYTSFPSRAGAIAALSNPGHIEQEKARNLEVRKYVETFFSKAGLEGSVSQTNFVFFDTGQPGESFRQACLEAGVQIRAEYSTHPTHARVSLGTMAEMQQATDVLSRLL
ncbi:MAG: pyridoxal phosphate-dependent aminotransferase, partial [Gammaproteobacteria bacterium]